MEDVKKSFKGTCSFSIASMVLFGAALVLAFLLFPKEIAFADETSSLDSADPDKAPPIARIGSFGEGDYFQMALSPRAKFVVGVKDSSIKDGANIMFQNSNTPKSVYFQFRFIESDPIGHNGYYIIVNANSGKALQPQGNSASSGAKAVLRPVDTANKSQHFSIVMNGGRYSIVNRVSGMALHSTATSPTEKTRLNFTNQGQSSSQKFSIVKKRFFIPEGTYFMSPNSSSKKVQVRSSKTSNGSKIVLRKSSSSMLQKWFIRQVSKSSNNYMIQNVQSGRYISCSNGKVRETKYSGKANQIWSASLKWGSVVFTNKKSGKVLSASSKSGLYASENNGSKSQRFSISQTVILPEGAYYIQPKSSSRVIGVTGHLTKAGSNVKLVGKTSSSSRKWVADINEDGTYTFRNANSARVLAVKGNSAKKGANVYQGSANSSKSRKWKLSLHKKGGINIVSALNGKSFLGSSSLRSGSNSKIVKYAGGKTALFKFKKTSKSSVRSKMERKIRKLSSKTDWLLVANTRSCFVGVFKGSKGNWTPYAYFPCSPGAPGSQSRKGLYRVGLKGYSFGTDSYTCYYYTQYSGNFLFHSILYNAGTFTVQDGRMGRHISHGCIRLEIANAKWINRNIPVGTTVYVY